jgi:hypothetical protein
VKHLDNVIINHGNLLFFYKNEVAQLICQPTSYLDQSCTAARDQGEQVILPLVGRVNNNPVLIHSLLLNATALPALAMIHQQMLRKVVNKQHTTC